LLIVDCLTVWVNNELHHHGVVDAGGVALALTQRIGPSVVITNEVGLGVHPETELGRAYRDELGRVNQAVAAVATKTLLLVAGRALRLGDPWKSSHDLLVEALATMPSGDGDAADAVRARAADILRPAGRWPVG